MDIKLVRIDYRLMHGQVVTNWIQQVSADAILIVDDKLAADPFLAQVYLMAAPPGVKVGIRSIEKAVKGLLNNVYKDKQLMIIFKSVESIHKAFELGFKPEKIQIGGLGSGTNKVSIINEISISKEEAALLLEMQNSGISVYLQATPKDPIITLNTALEQINKS